MQGPLGSVSDPAVAYIRFTRNEYGRKLEHAL